MTVKLKKESNDLTIDLTGQQGNAYVLLGIADTLTESWDKKQCNNLFERMTAGDYINLVAVFEMEFGHAITLLADMELLSAVALRIDELNEERKEKCGIAKPLGAVENHLEFEF